MEQQTSVEWLKSKVLYIVPSSQKDDLLRLFEQAEQIEKEQRLEFANWCRIHDNKYPLHIFTIQQLWDEYQKETQNK